MTALVFLEHHGDELQKGSLGVLAKAASLGEVAAVIAGEGAKPLAVEAGKFGAAKVWVCEDGEVEQPLPQPRVDVLAQVIEEGGYDTVLFANSVLAADVAAGLAARLDAGLNWDLVDVELKDGELVGKRPALQDSVYADVGWDAAPRLALFRAGSFEPGEGGTAPSIGQAAVSLAEHSTKATMLEQAHEESEGASIEDADVVVAGGRGLGGPDGFGIVEELARALGGAVGAPRATPAGTRTRRRSARPAGTSRRSSTSPAASAARSSTRSGCTTRARSSRSTRTRTPRSSSSPISASSATCSSSCRS